MHSRSSLEQVYRIPVGCTATRRPIAESCANMHGTGHDLSLAHATCTVSVHCLMLIRGVNMRWNGYVRALIGFYRLCFEATPKS